MDSKQATPPQDKPARNADQPPILQPGIALWRPVTFTRDGGYLDIRAEDIVGEVTDRGDQLFRVCLRGQFTYEPELTSGKLRGIAAFCRYAPDPEWTYAVVTRVRASAVEIDFQKPMDMEEYLHWRGEIRKEYDRQGSRVSLEVMSDIVRRLFPAPFPENARKPKRIVLTYDDHEIIEPE